MTDLAVRRMDTNSEFANRTARMIHYSELKSDFCFLFVENRIHIQVLKDGFFIPKSLRM